MKPVIKALISPDSQNLAEYVPPDQASFGLLFQLLIGPEGEEGFESFQTVVCTPKWLTDTHSKDEVVIGRHYLIVFEYSFERIMAEIDAFLATCTGATWHEVALKVGRLAYWEFEDYQE